MAAFLVDDESVRWGRSDYATSSSAAVRAVLSKSVRVLSPRMQRVSIRPLKCLSLLGQMGYGFEAGSVRANAALSGVGALHSPRRPRRAAQCCW